MRLSTFSHCSCSRTSHWLAEVRSYSLESLLQKKPLVSKQHTRQTKLTLLNKWKCLQDGQSSILPVPHGVSSLLRCGPWVRPLLRDEVLSIKNQSVIKLFGLFKEVEVWPPAPWGRCGYGMGPFISGSELQNFNHISCRFMYLLRKDEWSSAPEQWSSSPVTPSILLEQTLSYHLEMTQLP